MSALKVSEADWQQTIIDTAHVYGWIVAHFRPAQNSRGEWRTAVGADGKGFPDLVLVHPTLGVVFAEVKTATGKVTAEQQMWLGMIGSAGGRAYVWRPADWHQVETVLSGRTPLAGVA